MKIAEIVKAVWIILVGVVKVKWILKVGAVKLGKWKMKNQMLVNKKPNDWIIYLKKHINEKCFPFFRNIIFFFF